jgi:hypothetical protein
VATPEPPRRAKAARRPAAPGFIDPATGVPLGPRPRRSGQLRRSGPARRPQRVSDQVLAAIGLLIVGAVAAIGVQGVLESRAPTVSSAPSAEPTDDTGALASDVPEDSAPPVSTVLEGRIPATIDGVDLTTQSAVDATNLSGDPDGRALNAAIVKLGKAASDLEVALANDQSGTIDLTILGFRADGVDAATMRSIVLEAWLAAGTPGVTTSTVTLSGTQVTKVSYGDQGADEYLMTVDDSVFVLETTDPALATSAVAALMAGPGASPSAQAPSSS